MQNDSASATALTPALIFENLNAYQRTAALKAAIELDIFRAVGQGLDNAAAISRHAKASERGIRILCDFLVVQGLLQKVDGRYRHTASSAAFLDPASPSCLASIVRFLSLPDLRAPFEHLADVVRKGRTSLPGTGAVETENPTWVEFAQSMAPMMAPLAGPLGAVVLQGRTSPMRVLDIAAGHGRLALRSQSRTRMPTLPGSTGLPSFASRWKMHAKLVYMIATTCSPAAPSTWTSVGPMMQFCSPISCTT